MFGPSKPFYMTRAIAEGLPVEHQQFILRYLFEHNHQLTDYLQIYDIYIENEQQWLIQRQNEPQQETIIHVEITTDKPINRKVWVMDQVDHNIILFPEDYL
ncbi:DUF960 family protein [Ureibacillus aquaedulcis]|uniref:DUF960 family protein n=1 Tax=Ureibacillus aquaedulcis TaxID=3058421 RepID=A0ABT8GLN4_9BACL|nr:DUF960 family protein [Ureibacillus sp. BA0131]MDN4492149.1 DUF960 family protein [Ureibacillus sp. BA0131]